MIKDIAQSGNASGYTADEAAKQVFGAASSPIYTGSKAAWEFMGGESPGTYGPGRKFYRDQYSSGAEEAQNRRAPPVQGAIIQQDPQEQARQYQTALLAQLQQRAAGMGPTSQAEQMAISQGAANQRMALAQAVSARGLSPSAALRAATEQQGAAGIAAKQQQQLVRTAEQQQAQSALGALSTQLREQDVGLATGQAGLDQAAALANQKAALEQGALNDQLTQFYLDMGMSLAEAQAQAEIARQQMLSDIVQAQYNAQAGVVSSGIQSQSARQAAALGALGTVGMAYGQAYGQGNSQANGEE